MARWKRWFGGQSLTGDSGDLLETTFEWTYEPNVEPVPQRVLPQTGDQRAAASAELVQVSGQVESVPQALHAETALRSRPGRDAEQLPSPGRVPVQRALKQSFLRHQLDEAMALWWGRRELPSSKLLRAGLTALENGWGLDAQHRTLLLRAALYRRRGVLTALRHQDDPERTALVVAEALTSTDIQVPAEVVKAVAERDLAGRHWQQALLVELQAIAGGVERARAERALRALSVITADALPD